MGYIKRINSLDLAIHEITLIIELSHPTIIPILDINLTEDYGEIVMPNAQLNLYELIKNHYRLPDVVLKVYLDRIGTAIDYIHQQGIVHRDIKADNILIIDGLPYLSDFGISIHLEDECHWSMCSSEYYRAPEAFDELDIIDKVAIDMWALGILVLEILNWKITLFNDPLGEIAINDNELDLINWINSNYPINEEYYLLVSELLTIDPTKRRRWYGEERIINTPTIYLPTNPLLLMIREELLLPDYIFTSPINTIEELYVLCCQHNIYLSDKYCADKIDYNLYDSVLNVARDVLRPRKSPADPHPG